MRKTWQYFILSLSLMLALSACAPAAAEGPFNDYYVSTTGSNTSGDGSEANPWAGVQYAIEHADYSRQPVQINIGDGLFDENLNITQPVILRGAGPGDYLNLREGGTVIQWAQSPEDSGSPAHSITDAEVELYDMTFKIGRMRVEGGKLRVDNVWFDSISGFYALLLEDVSGFSVTNSVFRSRFLLYADHALRMNNSSGEIRDSTFGDLIDHPVDIWQYTEGALSVITIDNIVVHGSRLCYADGIRSIGKAILTITNSVITRDHSSAEAHRRDEAPCQLLDEEQFGDGVSAGIDLQGGRDPGIPLRTLQGNTISGFDQGIAIYAESMRVKAEDNDISALFNDVVTWFWEGRRHNTTGTVIDFGGGRLGSTGGNTFHEASPYAVRLNESYDISACYNEWMVPEDQIDAQRIFDKLDDPSSGRVIWTCLEQPEMQTPQVPLVPDVDIGPPQFLLDMDANCRVGDATTYDSVDVYLQGQLLQIDGRNQAGTWLWIQRPDVNSHCWVASSTGTVSGDLQAVPLIAAPTATPTATPEEQEPEARPTSCSYDQNQNLVCK